MRPILHQESWYVNRLIPTPGQAPAAQPAACQIGVNVEDLYDLDMARVTFGAILCIWSVCPSAALAPLGCTPPMGEEQTPWDRQKHQHRGISGTYAPEMG